MAVETALEPCNNSSNTNYATTNSADVRRHTSTSSQHSDRTLCNEPMYISPNNTHHKSAAAAAAAAHVGNAGANAGANAAESQEQHKQAALNISAVAAGVANINLADRTPASPKKPSADEVSSSIAQAIATSANAAPRVEKRPSLMQRFLGAASGNKSSGASAHHHHHHSHAHPPPTSASSINGAFDRSSVANSKRATPPASSAASSTTGFAGGHNRRPSESSTTFQQKYGTCSRECIGRGATAVVRVAYKQHKDGPQVYAIKRFRKQRANETEREYIKKLTSEYCISSSIHHKNVVSTLDLIQDPQKNWCQVMEYCPGGDLYSIIRDGDMGISENECCFKQMCEGIAHLHSVGVCHRDIKAENLLLDARNTVKITDFGVADVFRVAWEDKLHKSRGLCGSEPYIAPEMFLGKSYDGRKVDVWSAAIVYYTMVYNGIPWRAAKEEDPNFSRFLEAMKQGRDYEGFRKFDPATRQLIQTMLNPDPQARPTIAEVLKSDVLQKICVCDDDGQVPGSERHCHYTEEYEERKHSRKLRAQAAAGHHH